MQDNKTFMNSPLLPLVCLLALLLSACGGSSQSTVSHMKAPADKQCLSGLCLVTLLR
jgi:hypothetical protein